MIDQSIAKPLVIPFAVVVLDRAAPNADTVRSIFEPIAAALVLPAASL